MSVPTPRRSRHASPSPHGVPHDSSTKPFRPRVPLRLACAVLARCPAYLSCCSSHLTSPLQVPRAFLRLRAVFETEPSTSWPPPPRVLYFYPYLNIFLSPSETLHAFHGCIMFILSLLLKVCSGGRNNHFLWCLWPSPQGLDQWPHE